MIGVRNDVANVVDLKTDDDVLDVFPRATHSPTSIGLALADLRQTREQIKPWFTSMAKSSLLAYVHRLPKCPDRNLRLAHVSSEETRNFTLTRACLDLPCPTLVAIAQRPNGLSGIVHPENDRKFTIPEMKRLTSLPDDYRLTGTLSQGAERICNMVPPLLTKAIAERVYRRVLAPYRKLV